MRSDEAWVEDTAQIIDQQIGAVSGYERQYSSPDGERAAQTDEERDSHMALAICFVGDLGGIPDDMRAGTHICYRCLDCYYDLRSRCRCLQ